MSDFVIKPATRTGVKMLAGFYGRSGSGKSMSALLLMRGLIGMKGKLTLVDSESGRGSLFADIIPGGYQVIDLEPPFSPERYQAAFEAAESQSDGVVVDSMSHEHNGDGGVLDMQEAELTRMAGDNWSKREACKMASWIKPKMAHKKFIQRLLRCKVPLICCLRGEEKTHMLKGDDGKNKVITDDFSSPLFDPRFIFELLLNFETVAREGKGGYVIPRKVTHPSLAGILPGPNEQLSIKHGEALSKWCASAGGTTTAAKAAPTPSPADLKKLKVELWKITKPKHNGDRALFAQWLLDEGFIGDTEPVEELGVERLEQVIAAVRGHV